VGWLNKLCRQMKATSSHVDITALRTYCLWSITLVALIMLVMRGLASRPGGLLRQKSSHKKRPALVVLVIDGSLALYGRVVYSSANPRKREGPSKSFCLER
jgi:hypothetical protein